MKKYISVFLAIACIFMMAGCTAKNDEKKRLPELGDILQYTEEELKEKFTGISRNTVRSCWGKPKGSLSGDVFFPGGNNDKNIILYYDDIGKVTDFVLSDSDDEVRWEYIPHMSSRFPAMLLSFDTDYSEISATCDNGTLLCGNHGAIKSHGNSLTVSNTANFYWAPWTYDEESAEAQSAKIPFTVFGKDKEALYNGVITITGTKTFLYSVTMESSSGILIQDKYKGAIFIPTND